MRVRDLKAEAEPAIFIHTVRRDHDLFFTAEVKTKVGHKEVILSITRRQLYFFIESAIAELRDSEK